MERNTEQAIRTLTNWFPSLEGDPNFKITSLVALFEYFGFEQSSDSDREQGYDKVALYANNEGHSTTGDLKLRPLVTRLLAT